ncbi:MAG: hypothetical protein FJX62_13070 [Alphaproteobacteria bacterium]|nr:hypothetical protein [Alphaproteobacteria bacterium]
MSSDGQPIIERLRAFIGDLEPGSRALLMAELDRGTKGGGESAALELAVSELRRSLRAEGIRKPELGAPAQMFLAPLEPFAVDDADGGALRGRIAHLTFEPVWRWIETTLLPAEAKDYVAQVETALAAGDEDKADYLVRTFQDLAVRRIKQAMADLQGDEEGRLRLSGQLGTRHAIDVLNAVRGVLNVRDGLAMLGVQLPNLIRNFSGPHVESVLALVDNPLGIRSDLFVYSLNLVKSRLAAPWQLVRLAVSAAGSDEGDRIAATSYAVTVDIVMDEIEERIRALAADLKAGRGAGNDSLLKEIHDAVRGLRTELNIDSESAWGRRLAAIRTEVSDVLTAEIELAPGRVRRLLRPRSLTDIAGAAALDPHDVAETEALIALAIASRNYAGELAVNEAGLRIFAELQRLLDTNTRALLDGLRGADERERPFRMSQIDAAVRFCNKVFGGEYAGLLAKAADVAVHGGERRPLPPLEEPAEPAAATQRR